MNLKYTIGDLFLVPGDFPGRGILIEIKDVGPNTPYETFVVQSQPYESFVIHWSFEDHRTFEVGYNLVELNKSINKGNWKHIPVKQ